MNKVSEKSIIKPSFGLEVMLTQWSQAVKSFAVVQSSHDTNLTHKAIFQAMLGEAILQKNEQNLKDESFAHFYPQFYEWSLVILTYTLDSYKGELPTNSPSLEELKPEIRNLYQHILDFLFQLEDMRVSDDILNRVKEKLTYVLPLTQKPDYLSELHRLLLYRMEIVKKVAIYKHASNLPALDQKRFEGMVQKRVDHGQELGLKEEWIRMFYDKLHEISLKVEDEILNDSKTSPSKKVASLDQLREEIDDVDEAILKKCSNIDDLNQVMSCLDQLK